MLAFGEQPSLKRAWSGSRDQFYNFTPHLRNC